jgi:hypothetical protein
MSAASLTRHPGESRDLVQQAPCMRHEVPAFAGMTGFVGVARVIAGRAR